MYKMQTHAAEGKERTRHFMKERMESKWRILNDLNPYLIDPFVQRYLLQQDIITLTIIFSKIGPEMGGILLEKLPTDTQDKVLSELVLDKWIDPKEIEERTKDLLQVLAQLGVNPDGRYAYRNRMEEVNDLLGNVSEENATRLRERLAVIDPDASDQLKRMHLVFEDLLRLDDRCFQVLLREINNDELLAALKGASDKLKEKAFQNMSSRAADMMREDLEMMGPVKVYDVKNAQEIILKTARRLESWGSIVILGKSSDDVIL